MPGSAVGTAPPAPQASRRFLGTPKDRTLRETAVCRAQGNRKAQTAIMESEAMQNDASRCEVGESASLFLCDLVYMQAACMCVCGGGGGFVPHTHYARIIPPKSFPTMSHFPLCSFDSCRLVPICPRHGIAVAHCHAQNQIAPPATHITQATAVVCPLATGIRIAFEDRRSRGDYVLDTSPISAGPISASSASTS